MTALRQALMRLDGRGYKAYRAIAGEHALEGFTLHVDHVQADPYAAPSRMRALVPWQRADLPADTRAGGARTRAARDFLARAFARAARSSPEIGIDAGAQAVLERTACLFTQAGVELRFTVELPAAGRRIRGRRAAELICDELPEVVAAATRPERLDLTALARHCDCVEDQQALLDAV